MDRRTMIKSAALATAALGASPATSVAAQGRGNGRLTTSDGTQLFYRDWGTGKPMVFINAWSVSTDIWEYMMIRLVDAGLRCIAYDRRSHGRSSDPGRGYDFETLTNDFALVLKNLDLHDVTLVAHSMGSGEAVRYLSRAGSDRVSHLVLLAPTTPFLLKTADNPDGIDAAAFEKLRSVWKHDRAQWMVDNSKPFFTPETSNAIMDWGMRMMLQTSLKAMIDCNKHMTETDFRPDCRRVQVPTLIIHGDRDVSAPLELTGRKTAALIKGSIFKIYEGAPHGLPLTHADRLTADILAFIDAGALPAK